MNKITLQSKMLSLLFKLNFYLNDIKAFLCCSLLMFTERKVSFSASLGSDGDHGPVDTETRLVFTNIESNIGLHYSPSSGMNSLIKFIYLALFQTELQSASQTYQTLQHHKKKKSENKHLKRTSKN